MSGLTATAIELLAFARLGSLSGSRPVPGDPAALPLPLAAAPVVVLAAAILVLATHLVAGQELLDPLAARLLGADPALIGRTSLGTATALVLLAVAFLPAVRHRPRLADTLAGLVLLISLLALCAYAYGSADLYAMTLFRTMSLPTAIAIFLLAAAEILARPAGGWAATVCAAGAAGRVTRRQLLFLSIPLVLGWVLVQAAGANQLHLGGVVAVLVASTVAPLFWLIMHDGHSLLALERARRHQAKAEAAHLAILEQRLQDQAEALGRRSQQRLQLAQEATLRSEGRYRMLFDSIDVGFCVLEIRRNDDGTVADYRLVETNAAFERTTGLSAAQGQWMRTLVPGHEQHWFDIYGRVAETGTPVRFENAAAALGRCYDVQAFRVEDSPGHVGVLFNDITERRRVEQALQDMNATLGQRIEAALAGREQAQAALRQSQKMEAMGQLTGGVAHDFNNLLTPIIGGLDLLSRRDVGGPREQRLIGAALQSADRARVLVQRLLAFARRQPLQIGPVDLASLVKNMAELVTSTSGPQVQVRIVLAPGLPAVLADANQLEMAILNLSVNARDAMPGGGVLEIAAAEAPDGHSGDLPAGLAPGRYVRLSVRDTGTGMDAETLKRAVEPFYSTKGIGKGTGLGLSMVHGLAAQMNGALGIDSRPGEGTRVDLWLPLSPMPPNRAAAAAPDPVAAGMRGRVLVVDDEVAVRLTTSDMLQELGFGTVEAGSAREAEALLLAGEAFDLVVTDHLMPGMSGAEFARTVRDRWPGLPVLLVSGYADAAGVAADLPRLAKPFRHADLADAVRSIMPWPVRPP